MLKVLLVDDEPIFRMGLRMGIDWAKSGCSVVGEAKNGEEALIQIENKKPDMVFLDIKMPKMDGIDVLKRMKGKKDKPYFIVLSCFNEYEYVREAMKLGACDYLFKPLMQEKDIEAVLQEVSNNIQSQGKRSQEEEHRLAACAMLKELSEDGKELILSELLEMCPSLGEVPYFFLTVKIPGQQFTAKKQEAFLTLCKSVLESCFDNGRPPLFFDSGTILYGVFFCGPGEDWEKETSRKNLWKRIKEYVEVPVWVGSSRCVEGIEQVSRAMEEAKGAMDLHYFSCYGRMEEFQEFREGLCKSREFEVIFAKELQGIRDAFGSYEIEEIKALLEKICRVIQDDRLYSEKDFTHLLANIIIGNMREYKYRNIMEELIMENYDAISNLYHQETMEEACNYVLALLERIFELVRNKTGDGISRTDTMKHVLVYMEEHYAEKLTMPDMAKKVNMSDKYFCKLFKESTGETFVEHLTNIRVLKAKEMLERTSLKTYQVADQVGFHDYHHFCRTYKKITGKTPKESRMEAIEKKIGQ